MGYPQCVIYTICADIFVRKTHTVGLSLLTRTSTCFCRARARTWVLPTRQRNTPTCRARELCELDTVRVRIGSGSFEALFWSFGRNNSASVVHSKQTQCWWCASDSDGGDSKPNRSLDGAIVCCFRDFCSIRLELFYRTMGSSRNQIQALFLNPLNSQNQT